MILSTNSHKFVSRLTLSLVIVVLTASLDVVYSQDGMYSCSSCPSPTPQHCSSCTSVRCSSINSVCSITCSGCSTGSTTGSGTECTASSAGAQPNPLSSKQNIVILIFLAFIGAGWVLRGFYQFCLPVDSENPFGDAKCVCNCELASNLWLWNKLAGFLDVFEPNDSKLVKSTTVSFLPFFTYIKLQHPLYECTQSRTFCVLLLSNLLATFSLSIAFGSISASSQSVVCSGPGYSSSNSTSSGSGNIEYGSISLLVAMFGILFELPLSGCCDISQKYAKTFVNVITQVSSFVLGAGVLVTLIIYRSKFDSKWDIGPYILLFVISTVSSWIINPVLSVVKYVIGAKLLPWPPRKSIIQSSTAQNDYLDGGLKSSTHHNAQHLNSNTVNPLVRSQQYEIAQPTTSPHPHFQQIVPIPMQYAQVPVQFTQPWSQAPVVLMHQPPIMPPNQLMYLPGNSQRHGIIGPPVQQFNNQPFYQHPIRGHYQ